MDPRDVWLLPYLRLQSTYDQQLAQALDASLRSTRQALRRLAGKGGIGAAVRREQLTQIEAELHRQIANLFGRVGDIATAGQHAASAQAISSGIDWDSLLLRRIYPSASELAAVRRNAVAQAPRNVQALIIKLRGAGLPLSQQVYRTQALAQGWVMQAVNAAIGRGATWRELTADVSRFINPDVPGGVSYAAKRLARTEINNAYHAVSVADAAGKPWVRSMTWNLSRSHPEHDICDTLAGQHYALDEVPAKPHPQCFCYVTPDTMSSAQFTRLLNSGAFDDYLIATYGKAA